jgi:hypothetical protein
MRERIVYVYGIVPALFDPSGAPPGLDGAPVELERDGALAALVSLLDAETYAGGTAEMRAGDVSWIGPRAVAHDAVLSWASEAGGVLPLPMFTLFSELGAVHRLLRERSPALTALLERVAPAQEYTVRLFLDPARRSADIPSSPRLAGLEERARSAPPGQRYLLERKLEEERRAERRRVAGEAVGETYTVLAARAIDAVRDPVPGPARDPEAARAVLDASFLVLRTATAEFQHALGTLVERYEPHGLRFELTGPWPPYHFVREAV